MGVKLLTQKCSLCEKQIFAAIVIEEISCCGNCAVYLKRKYYK